MSGLRFKLCEMWNCSVNDEKFDTISIPQWKWYNLMFAKKDQEIFDKQLALTEYLAMFWNPEAVKKIREMREQREQHSFQSDEEFEESVLREDYKNNPYIKAIQEINKSNNANLSVKDIEKADIKNKKMKGPLDLDRLAKKI